MGKPNVIILGGLNVCSKSLAAFLAPPEGESLVENLRIIDKFSVAPATTYIGPELPKTIARPNVEYRQANLTIPETVRSVFDPPEGQAPYDYVFDFTGETRHDRPDEFHIKHTFTLSRLIGQEAARRNVKAYIRLMHPFYEMPDKGVFEEKDDLKPEDVTGHWWHETLRTLAAIDNLNLVILRMAFVYGPYVDFGQISSLFQVAGVYGFMKQPMRALHSPGKHAVNTVHVYDVIGAAWAAAEWMARLGREQANTIAGEPILFKNDKKKVKDVEGIVDPEKTLTAPLFNIVDDNETTWVKAGTTATAAFGTTFEFFNLMVSALAKFKLEDQVEDINQHHVGAWNTMVSSSNPTVVKSPLTAYMDLYDLQKHVVSLSNAKIKRVMNYQLKRPEFGQAEIKEFIEKAKEDRIWPNV